LENIAHINYDMFTHESELQKAHTLVIQLSYRNWRTSHGHRQSWYTEEVGV